MNTGVNFKCKTLFRNEDAQKIKPFNIWCQELFLGTMMLEVDGTCRAEVTARKNGLAPCARIVWRGRGYRVSETEGSPENDVFRWRFVAVKPLDQDVGSRRSELISGLGYR